MKIENVLLTLMSVLFVTNLLMSQELGTFQDSRDNKVYKTVKIGTKIWMSENLAFSCDSCWAYDNSEENLSNYGYLYNWESAMKACPVGWRLPSYNDWSDLVRIVGDESNAGGKIKQVGTTNWQESNIGATDEFGFTALPGGIRSIEGDFGGIGIIGFWWSSTFDSVLPKNAYGFSVENTSEYFYGFDEYDYAQSKLHGLSVRCIKN